MTKSTTDRHWNDRAASVENDIEVNIMDIFQRELEYDYVGRYLTAEMRILEIGCGNGFSTERFRDLVAHVDAFDYAENMVERAKARVGERNNRFFHDNLLDPRTIAKTYDAVVCVRVLINLRDLAEQMQAARNLARFTRSGGRLVLVEGYTEGFEALSKLRRDLGMKPVAPAEINRYCSIGDLMPTLLESFEPEHEFHLGAYDYLTRVVYPTVAGEENVRHNTEFSERCADLARVFNPDCFKSLSRIRGFVMRRKPN